MVNDSRFKRAIASGNKLLTIQFEGKPLPAFEGETVAATLLANGINASSRSTTYRTDRHVLNLYQPTWKSVACKAHASSPAMNKGDA